VPNGIATGNGTCVEHVEMPTVGQTPGHTSGHFEASALYTQGESYRDPVIDLSMLLIYFPLSGVISLMILPMLCAERNFVVVALCCSWSVFVRIVIESWVNRAPIS